ncbi:MAG TPA: proline dehydrogenase family protein [Verrucomicrobiae bacterium]|jgi:RHH-type proline utilization regulon transcriptional repressor/proline dehydrogenase/delta 1-pyrroline-5-carboxylate dehydrogenase|nr:proline dehydrogenase family protein [Verrucomicrobiae bacterium]
MSDLEKRTAELGQKLLAAARQEELALQKKHRLESALLDWCMKNDELRTRTFRFIDVFPSLKTADAVLRHIQEYFPASEHRLPAALRAGMLLGKPALLTKFAFRKVTERMYRDMASLFIAAADEGQAIRRVRELDAQGVRASIDLLGEKTSSPQEAFEYEARYARLIETLGREHLGPEKQNVSVKLSALDPLFHPADPEGTSRRVRERLRGLFEIARKSEVFLHTDMEDYESRGLTLRIVRELLNEEAFRGGVHAGIVLQAYLKDADACCEEILAWARKLPAPLTIRLVRGAYWDSEIMKARELGWPVPVFTRKSDTDWMFEKLIRRLMDEPRVRLAVATHNVRSIAYAMALAEEKSRHAPDLEFQVLYGMGAPLIPAIKAAGYAPRVYMPIGDPVVGMAYLVRRLLENVSSQSFVRRGIHDPAQSKTLLAPPPEPLPETAPAETGELQDYRATPVLEFHREGIHHAFREALKKIPMALGESIPVMIDGKRRPTKSRMETVSPADGRTRVASVAMASAEDAQEAVASSRHHFESWKRVPAHVRAGYLRKAALWMLENRLSLAALQVYEAGKTWREADADVVEAVDYLNFYAFHAPRLMKTEATDYLDHEKNALRLMPRGVAAVIAPWNFPMAILTGMSAAALVTGNTAILKPAEQSVFCAWKVFQAYEAAGIPAGVVQFLPGFGEIVGSALVGHPDTAVIAFTGSKETGLALLQNANDKTKGPRLVKKVIAEMGGKNAVIVDSSADFDQALPAVLYSAFGYAGQKCSALSRLIVVDDVYEAFVKRLAEAAESFPAGYPWDPGTMCGPVIDAAALQKIQGYVEKGKAEGRLLFEGKLPPDLKGFYVPPVIFSELPENSALLLEEIFGPVLCVIRAPDFKTALEIANRSEFALTGGVFSRTPSHLALAKDAFQAGNLYLNRGVTGAVVGRQPFGGFKLSGGGTKAGSADYLREFCIPQTVTENVARHGFAPLDQGT